MDLQNRKFKFSLSPSPMHHTKICKHGLKIKRSLLKYKDLKAEREIASFKSSHKWDYWCVTTSRYDHCMPCASIQKLWCLEKDLLFLKTENQMITSTCVPPSLNLKQSSPNRWCINLINRLGADYRTTTPPMKNIARNK